MIQCKWCVLSGQSSFSEIRANFREIWYDVDVIVGKFCIDSTSVTRDEMSGQSSFSEIGANFRESGRTWTRLLVNFDQTC